MNDFSNIPNTPIEQAEMMEDILVTIATGGHYGNSEANKTYKFLRQELRQDLTIKALLPDFVHQNRNLQSFWGFIKKEHASYAGRRSFIYDAFTHLIDHLSSQNTNPSDIVIFDTLKSSDTDRINAIWLKRWSGEYRTRKGQSHLRVHCLKQ